MPRWPVALRASPLRSLQQLLLRSGSCCLCVFPGAHSPWVPSSPLCSDRWPGPVPSMHCSCRGGCYVLFALQDINPADSQVIQAESGHTGADAGCLHGTGRVGLGRGWGGGVEERVSGPGDFRVPGWGIWRLFPSRRQSGFPHGLTHLVPLALAFLLFPTLPSTLGSFRWHKCLLSQFRGLK